MFSVKPDPVPDGALDDAPAVVHNLAFVTSSVTAGDFGGVAEADQKCQAAAQAALLPENTYVAWISDTTVNAIDRLGTARGWTRTDGQPVADRVSTLAAEGPLVPLLLTEDGANVLASPQQNVWTGTDGVGAKHPMRCGDWTDPKTSGVFGTINRGAAGFTAANALSCTSSFRLYCFGIDHTEPLELPVLEDSAFVFFVSDGLWSPGNRTVADTLCTDEAAAAGLTGRYRAALTPNGKTLADVLPTSKVYTRSDGLTLGTVLNGATANTFPLLTAKQTLPADFRVWTGGISQGTPEATCGDWSASGSGLEGLASDVGPSMFVAFTVDCTVSARVYCARFE